MRGKKKWIALDDPPPDLAVEIDITSSWLDRLEIYAALRSPRSGGGWRNAQAPRPWRNGKYKQRTKSLAFPALPMDGFALFVKKLGTADEISLIREFTEWLRSNFVPKKATPSGRMAEGDGVANETSLEET